MEIYEKMKSLKNKRNKEKVVDKDIKKIKSFCDLVVIGTYVINLDNTVSVTGMVNMAGHGLKSIPVKFKEVSEGFNCSGNTLTNLIGAPDSIGTYFNCSDNLLTSLVGLPCYIHDFLMCHTNRLESFQGLESSTYSPTCRLHVYNNPTMKQEDRLDNFKRLDNFNSNCVYLDSDLNHSYQLYLRAKDRIKNIADILK